MRGRKKTDATRQAIVKCAAEVFSEREFHEVLTDDIAERLGMGKGTIYRYFRSKEELYLAAIGDGLDGVHAAVKTVLETEAPLATTIEALVRTLIDYFWKRRDFFLLMHRLEPKLKPQQRTDWERQRLETVAMVQRRIERAGPRGGVNHVNTRLAVEALFGMIRSLCVYRADSDRPEELTRLATHIFLRGLGAATAEGRSRRARTFRVVQGGRRRS
ncbi:MAG TPA: TetR/AcrR family transcriptional regulator [Candidatus Acidoferrales bacterium]|nr:TetR/AcrR family transcriptional regulator [Candidatus Acidoferrales bacterium]